MPVSRSSLTGEPALGILASVCRLLRRTVVIGAMITILSFLAIGTLQTHTNNDSTAQGITGLSAHVVVKQFVAEAGTFGIACRQGGSCSETSGPSQHNSCSSGSNCLLAFNNVTNATIAPLDPQNFIAREQTSMSPLELNGQFRPPRIYS